ncbi:Putative cytochrome P450 [Septoria linicola]|uniref:Cytochrome P450 n=1 Tax=Septoria linicola TaxID=215465 RepID=A0A9Q9ACR9_9PEZI|nr:putative cytochrome P450 [Septoria linicola]USW47164.1 Putative cytochrome P450 [Septoria linicola]
MAKSDEPQSIVGLLFQPQIFPFFLLAVLYTAIKIIDKTNVPKIKGLPEVPGVPILGNLRQLGDNHAVNAMKMAKKYGPVFQVRLGNRRVVFANTFESVKNLWITNQSALISRPTLHTFHTVVSSSEGFTIGTSPWDESCKARRKAAATALNRPAVASYMPILEYESTKSIKEMVKDSKYGERDVDINLYFSRFALSTSLTLNYGYKIEGNIDDELLQEIVHVEREISKFRSTATNWADYIPLMRLLPGNSDKPLQYKARRAKYMWKLLNGLKERMAEGKDKPCISGHVLKDPEAKLSEAEVMSIGLSMVSAGLDTVPSNLIMGVAYLSSPHGQEIQKRAYDEIQAQYPNNNAWERCLHEEKCEFITALVKETLRFWSVIPICLPRRSVKDITWGNANIPAGTDFYMNAFAAHYDDTHFKDPYSFNPDRYLSDKTIDDASATRGTPHYGYGAGSRMCIGSHLANRELYTAFLKIITAFEVVEAKDPKDRPILDCMGCNELPNGLTMDPKPFKIGLRPRNRVMLDKWIAESEERTKDL